MPLIRLRTYISCGCMRRDGYVQVPFQKLITTVLILGAHQALMPPRALHGHRLFLAMSRCNREIGDLYSLSGISAKSIPWESQKWLAAKLPHSAQSFLPTRRLLPLSLYTGFFTVRRTAS